MANPCAPKLVCKVSRSVCVGVCQNTIFETFDVSCQVAPVIETILKKPLLVRLPPLSYYICLSNVNIFVCILSLTTTILTFHTFCNDLNFYNTSRRVLNIFNNSTPPGQRISSKLSRCFHRTASLNHHSQCVNKQQK